MLNHLLKLVLSRTTLLFVCRKHGEEKKNNLKSKKNLRCLLSMVYVILKKLKTKKNEFKSKKRFFLLKNRFLTLTKKSKKSNFKVII